MSIQTANEYVPHSFPTIVEELNILKEFIEDLNLLDEWRLYKSIVREQQQIEKLRANGMLIDF